MRLIVCVMGWAGEDVVRLAVVDGVLEYMRLDWEQAMIGAMQMLPVLGGMDYSSSLLLALVMSHTTAYRPRTHIEVA
ncbi:hypothetical protein [Bifidobacterium magnum]|uniref:Uncharacterized protein n=1 Tax=Bifidobacterium magnum TaxID=1692 RepID=A0A087BA77_9BIFI|nr:hypothetical protein [Bifidobacterium magnum]KFI67927.1 hypothetical protein BMAGN_0920 [Bifidobacterium magnum]